MPLPEKNGLTPLYRMASTLAAVTIFYNMAEGIVSVWIGAQDETITLFGFGIDSFVEVVSGIGIWHMVSRTGRGEASDRDRFERQALRVTGWSFFALSAGLFASAAASAIERHRPVSTLLGVVVSLLSIACMQALIHYKVKVGRELNSPAILADAACSRACLQFSLALLLASAGYALTGIGYLDAAGSLAIAALSFREGREALLQARGMACSCGDCGR